MVFKIHRNAIEITALAALAMIVVARTPALASVTVYTGAGSEAAFLAALQPGYYTEDFTGIAQGNLGLSKAYSQSGFGYTFTASSNVLWGVPAGGGAMSTGLANVALIATFTGNPVTGVGGFFFGTDDPGNFVTSTVTVALSGGATQTITQTTSALEFLGFTSTDPILSIQTTSASTSYFPTVDHFIVGAAAVPEPVSIVVWSLLALTAGGATWWRRRNAVA